MSVERDRILAVAREIAGRIVPAVFAAAAVGAVKFGFYSLTATLAALTAVFAIIGGIAALFLFVDAVGSRLLRLKRGAPEDAAVTHYDEDEIEIIPPGGSNGQLHGGARVSGLGRRSERERAEDCRA